MIHSYLSILIIFASCIALYLAYWLIKIAAGTVKIPLISTFFMLNYLVIIYIGSVLLNVFHFNYPGLDKRPDLLLYTWLYATAGLFLIPLGMIVVNIATGYKAQEKTRILLAKEINITSLDKSNFTFIVLILLFFISFVVLMIYRRELGILPIEGVFKGFSYGKLAYLRELSINQFTGHYYRYRIFMVNLPLLLLLIAFFMKKVAIKYKLLFYFLLLFNIFVNIMSLMKAPVVFLLIILLIAYIYLKRSIRKKQLISMSILIGTLLTSMSMFFMGNIGRSFRVIFSGIIRRICIGQIMPFFHYQLYWEKFGSLGISSFLPNPGGILPFESIPYTVKIKEFAFPEAFSSGVGGSMPTVFFGQWLISFGPLMALFSMVLLGIIIQSMDIFFVTKLANKKGVFLLALFINIIYFMSGFVGTGYGGILIHNGWIMPLFVILSIYAIRAILKEI